MDLRASRRRNPASDLQNPANPIKTATNSVVRVRKKV